MMYIQQNNTTNASNIKRSIPPSFFIFLLIPLLFFASIFLASCDKNVDSNPIIHLTLTVSANNDLIKYYKQNLSLSDRQCSIEYISSTISQGIIDGFMRFNIPVTLKPNKNCKYDLQVNLMIEPSAVGSYSPINVNVFTVRGNAKLYNTSSSLLLWEKKDLKTIDLLFGVKYKNRDEIWHPLLYDKGESIFNDIILGGVNELLIKEGIVLRASDEVFNIIRDTPTFNRTRACIALVGNLHDERFVDVLIKNVEDDRIEKYISLSSLGKICDARVSKYFEKIIDQAKIETSCNDRNCIYFPWLICAASICKNNQPVMSKALFDKYKKLMTSEDKMNYIESIRIALTERVLETGSKAGDEMILALLDKISVEENAADIQKKIKETRIYLKSK